MTTKTLTLTLIATAFCLPKSALADDPTPGSECENSGTAGVHMYVDSDKDGWGTGALTCVTTDDRSGYALRLGDPDDSDPQIRGERAHRSEYHSLSEFGRNVTALHAKFTLEGASPENCAALTELLTPETGAEPWSARPNFASVTDNKVALMLQGCQSANFVTRTELSEMGFVTRDELDTILEGYATNHSVDSKITTATTDMATKSWVGEQGFLTGSEAYGFGSVGGFGLPTDGNGTFPAFFAEVGAGLELGGMAFEGYLSGHYGSEGMGYGGGIRGMVLGSPESMAKLLAGAGVNANPFDSVNGDGFANPYAEIRPSFGEGPVQFYGFVRPGAVGYSPTDSGTVDTWDATVAFGGGIEFRTW